MKGLVQEVRTLLHVHLPLLISPASHGKVIPVKVCCLANKGLQLRGQSYDLYLGPFQPIDDGVMCELFCSIWGIT